ARRSLARRSPYCHRFHTGSPVRDPPYRAGISAERARKRRTACLRAQKTGASFRETDTAGEVAMLFITRNELKRMMDQRKDFVLIETRPAEDFEREHIPGAINVPLDEPGFEERIREACPEVDRDVIVYGDGMESLRDAAMRLESLGYTSIY